MREKRGVYWVTCYIVFILMLGNLPHVTDFAENDLRSITRSSNPKNIEETVSYTPHLPIAINGDANFNATAGAEMWPGDGSFLNPYIIEGLEIDRNGASGHCIDIRNTRANFTIRNCLLTDASTGGGSGIYLNNVTFGVVTGNLMERNGRHIQPYNSHSVLIENNTFIDGNFGIWMRQSDSNMIIDNTFSSNSGGSGIAVIDSSNANTIFNNTILDSGEAGIEIEGYSNIVSYNNISNCLMSIKLQYFLYNVLANNTFTRNTYGIWSSFASQTNITGNTCTDNVYGIYFEAGDKDIVTNNTFTNNDYGLGGDGAGDIIFLWNILADNSQKNLDSEIWGTVEHNYWSDYAGPDLNRDGVGDTPYLFVFGSDPYPLTRWPGQPPLVWIASPMDQTIEFGEVMNFQLMVKAYSTFGVVDLWLSDTVHFGYVGLENISSIGVIPVGLYSVEIQVKDYYDNVIQGLFEVLVTDSTSPTWVIEPTNQVVSQNLEMYIPVWDLSGIDHWTLNNSAEFDINATYYSDGSTARITNISSLSTGVYWLNVSAHDPYDNKLSAIFAVTVEPLDPDITPPLWVTLRISQTVEYGHGVEVQVEAWDESGIDHFWLNDTSHFVMDEYGTIRNATRLDLGIYRLEVRAYDPFDNYCSAILVFTVIESLLPSTTTSTTPPATSPPPVNIDPMMTLVFGAGIGGVAVVVVAIVFLKRRT